MTLLELDTEILLLENLIRDHKSLFEIVLKNIEWDDSMKSRKTASFGMPYDYSNMEYERIKIPKFLDEVITFITPKILFTPNNCLINYYYEFSSSMGYHADRIDILEGNTGICIISLGNKRTMRFRNKQDKEITRDYVLEPGSLFLMSQLVQEYWDHAILKSSNHFSERVSLTFRRIKQ